MFNGTEQVEVVEVIDSRYKDHTRPADWSQRVEGFDTVKLKDGRVIKLFSNAQQDVPKKGWILVLSHKEDKVHWTLYGFSEQATFSLDDF